MCDGIIPGWHYASNHAPIKPIYLPNIVYLNNPNQSEKNLVFIKHGRQKSCSELLTCEHELGGVSCRENHQPSDVRGQTHDSHPGVFKAALHDLQPQQTSQVGQVLSS